MIICRFFLWIFGIVTGHTRMRQAEEKWKSKNGEIPDGYCLIYRDGVCHPKKIWE